MAKSGNIRAGGAFVELFAEDSQFRRTLAQAQDRLRNFGAAVRAAGAGLTAVGAAISAPLAASVSLFSSYGDSIAKMARRTGLATETLSGLAHAADLSGTSIEAIEKGVRKMQRTIYDAAGGSKEAAEGIAAVGLSVEELRGLSPEDQFFKMSSALASVADESNRAALAQVLFGRSGAELIPLLSEGADAIARMRNEALELGLVLDSAAAAQAEKLNDSLGRVQSAFKGVGLALGKVLAPIAKTFADALTAALVVVKDFVSGHPKLVTAIAAIGGVSLVAGGAMLAFGAAIAALSLVSGPVLIAGAAVAAAFGSILVGAKLLPGAAEYVRSAMGAITDAIDSGQPGLAAKAMWKEVELAFVGGIKALRITTFNLLGDLLKHLPAELFDPFGVFPGLRGALGALPSVAKAITDIESEELGRLLGELAGIRAEIAARRSSSAGPIGRILQGVNAFENASGFNSGAAFRRIDRFGVDPPTKMIVDAINRFEKGVLPVLVRIEARDGLVFG